MERNLVSLEQHEEFLYDELEDEEKDIDKLKKSLDNSQDKCRKKSTAANCDQIEDLRKVVEEQRIKIFCLRKHRDDIFDHHEKVIDDYEKEFKEKENDIKSLQEVSKEQKKEISDVKKSLPINFLK